MRALFACLVVAVLAVAAVALGHPDGGTPLWSGARYTRQDRDRAVQRGLNFIYESIACKPGPFDRWGHDLVGAFYNIAVTSQDAELRRIAWKMGHERAIEWRRIHPRVPPGADATDVTDLVFGHDSAVRLGVPDARMHRELTEAAARFSAYDYLGFDPLREPPPSDLPKACRKCGYENPRGTAQCTRCGEKLTMWSRYDLWQDALIDSYTGDRIGITLGAHYREVLKLLPAMRPYPSRDGDPDLYYSGVYAVTHLIYTYNDYSQSRVSKTCFPEEFEHLKANLRQAIADEDPETMGEYLDTLRAFGLGFEDPLIRSGFEYLLKVQNRDGSWGDVTDPNPYGRYHPTWTAVDGLREYRWTRVLPCPPTK